MNKIAFFFILFLFSFGVAGQTVTGYVKDLDSREPVPFASVVVKGTTQGVMTDIEGYFTISSPQGDTLQISSVGYIGREYSLDSDSHSEITIFLQSEVTEIDEVTVRPDRSASEIIMEQVRDNRRDNRRRVNQVERFNSLANTSVYLALDTASRVQRLTGNLEEISVGEDGDELRFSPIYIAQEGERVLSGSDETVYEDTEAIFPRLIPFIESYILQHTVVDLDFYRENISIFDRGFVSPISSRGDIYYDYFFNDTIFVDGKEHYYLSFAPKNRYNPLFAGNFIVEGENFALTEINVHVPGEANLNFINGFRGGVRYKQLDDGTWFYDEQQVRLNMSLRLSRDTVSKYGSERVDEISSGNWLIDRTVRYSTSEEMFESDPSQWRYHTDFTSDDISTDAYVKIDALRDLNAVKFVDAIGGLALTGYMNAGKIDVGPVFDIYSNNYVEGSRFSIPLRTSEEFNDRFSVGGFLSYGDKSKEVKYGFNFDLQPGPTDRFILRFNYADDYSLISHDKYMRFIKNNPNNRGTSNFIALFTARERTPYLIGVENYNMRLEYNADNDVQLEISPYYNRSSDTPYIQFNRNGENYSNYSMKGVMANLRLPFGQHYDKFFFDRIYYVSTIPVVNFGVDVGKTSLPNSNVDLDYFTQIHGSIQGRINLGPAFMNYIFEAGYLYGDAPYELLNQPVGSMSLGYARDSYNLLHHAAFANNIYSNTHLHFNGGGFLFNRIPFLRDLQLREIVSLKSHIGSLNSDYSGVFDLPDHYVTDFSTPYTEIGFGVTNILKVLRVEYVQQLSGRYRNQDFTDNSGIRIRAEMSF
ncbi:DUF5686 family protein [Marinilabiliaceae bacterium ANBcel2]|nr:DUF5686 family protein [Marinilabiliaceae bacterium ANBcel2]